MAVTLPTRPPTDAIAGDTWAWTDTSTDYPASAGWVVAFRIAGPDVLAWDASWAVADGDEVTVTVPASATEALTAGTYLVSKSYTLAAERYTSACGALVVQPNPENHAPGATVSFAERTLAKIEAFLEGHLEDGVQYYMIGTRQVGSIPLPELIEMRTKLRAEVAARRRGASGILGPSLAFEYRRPVASGDGF